MLYLLNEVRDPQMFFFFFISETSNSLAVRSRSLKELYRVEHFRANALKGALLQMPRNYCGH